MIHFMRGDGLTVMFGCGGAGGTSRGRAGLLIGLIIIGACGCVSHRISVPSDRMPVGLSVSEAAEDLAPGENMARLQAAPATLAVLNQRLLELQQEWQDVLEPLTERKYKDITSKETDDVERLLFRNLMIQETLCDMVSFFSAYTTGFSTEVDQTRSLVTAFYAASVLSRHTGWLVATCMDEPVLVRKLNEAHYRYGIDDGAFDRLFFALTAPRSIEDTAAARSFVAAESVRLDSCLNRLVRQDPDFSRMLADTAWLWMQSDELTQDVLRRRSIVLPAVTNRLRQNELANQARKTTRIIADNLYLAQGLLYNTVSDFKRPVTPHIVFSPAQVSQVKSMLQPGDIIMTYSAGYMSNVFLPGKFKHGITYVGSPAQRRSLNIAAAPIEIADSKRSALAADLELAALPSGAEADVIEAVAEGVIFNSLESLMHNHVNRMAVLRPRLADVDRQYALASTFLLLGCQYDFNFDFVDTTYQCCTEVIYRSLYRRGGIDFKLVPRGGVQTLAADDIIDYHFSCKTPLFDFILLAEEDVGSGHNAARVLVGAEGSERLKSLMQEQTHLIPMLTGSIKNKTGQMQD